MVMKRHEEESVRLVLLLESATDSRERNKLFRELVALNDDHIKGAAKRNYRPQASISLLAVEEAALIGFFEATRTYKAVSDARGFLEHASREMREQIAFLYMDRFRVGANLPGNVINRIKRGAADPRKDQNAVGLSNPSSIDEDPDLIDSLPDSRDAWSETILASWTERIHAALDNVLIDKFSQHKSAILLRYGFDDKGEKSLEQVGQEMGISRERVRQLESKALYLLRRPQARLRELESEYRSRWDSSV